MLLLLVVDSIVYSTKDFEMMEPLPTRTVCLFQASERIYMVVWIFTASKIIGEKPPESSQLQKMRRNERRVTVAPAGHHLKSLLGGLESVQGTSSNS